MLKFQSCEHVLKSFSENLSGDAILIDFISRPKQQIYKFQRAIELNVSTRIGLEITIGLLKIWHFWLAVRSDPVISRNIHLYKQRSQMITSKAPAVNRSTRGWIRFYD